MKDFNDFWEHDRSRMSEIAKKGWFSRLSPLRRVCYLLFLAFAIFWAFYAGFSYAGAIQPKWDGYMITGDVWAQEEDYEAALGDDIQVILAVGCDKRVDQEDTGRTDTIMLAFVDPENKTIRALSIPRDTYVTISGTDTKTKINHSYSYGGIPLTEQTIEDFLGVNVDNYIEVDFAGFTGIIDELGGVNINVEQRMYTPWENIDLQPGQQLLNGEDALGYVRYREKTMADIGRVGRQQQFLSALSDQVFKISNFWKIPKLVNIAAQNCDTDLSTKEMMSIIALAMRAEDGSIEMYMVPGAGEYINGVSYWMADDQELSKMMSYLKGETDSYGTESTDNSTTESTTTESTTTESTTT